MPGSIWAFGEWTVSDFKSLTLMHGHFMAAAVTAVTYSSPTYTYDLAPHHTRVTPITLGTPTLTHVSLIHRPPTLPALQRREMIKRWVSMLQLIWVKEHRPWQRRWKMGGGREQKVEWVGEFMQRAAGSYKLCHGSYCYPLLQSPDSKPSRSPPSPNYRQAHIFLGQLLLKTDRNK